MPLAPNPGVVTPVVHVDGPVDTRPNLTDYVQIAYLSGVLSEQRTTNDLLRQQITQQKIQFWKTVAQERFGVRGAMATEDAGIALYQFDRQETLADGWRQDYAPGQKEHSLNSSVWAGVKAFLFTAVLGFIAWWVVGALNGSSTTGEWPNSGEGLRLFVLIAPGAIAAVWTLVTYYRVISGSGHDPKAHSLICRTVYPGARLKHKSGKTIVVTGWPQYVSGRLFFYIPVKSSDPHQYKDGDGYYIGSDAILWEGELKANIGGRG
jgi:hypothetical protein